jgi:hypothetical protein
MTIEQVLLDFARDSHPRAVALRGRWGTGKTFFWKNQIVPNLAVAQDGYSYVSLFGIDSLGALKAATAVTATALPSAEGKPADLKSMGVGELWQGLKAMVRLVAREGGPLDTPYVSVPGVAMGIALRQMKERVICFDDLERRGTGLALRDFLGFVTYLVQERNCRVLVIANDESLVSDVDWNEQREKVFDWDVRLEPTPDEAMEIGLKVLDGSIYREDVSHVLRTFSATNIRLIVRCAEHALECIKAIVGEGLQPSTISSIVRSASLYAYSVHGRGSGAPPMEFLKQRGVFGRKKSEDPVEAAIESGWEAKLNELAFYFKDETDAVIAQYAERGYLDSASLREAAHVYDVATLKNEAKERFYNAWKIFHSSTGGSKEEVINALRETWQAVSPYESANNLEGLVQLLRELGESDLATSYIQDWVQQRATNDAKDLDDREIHIFRQITDKELLDTIAAAKKNAAVSPTLSAAFSDLREGGFSDEAINIVEASSPESIAQYWQENDNRDTLDVVRNLLRFTSSIPRHESAKNKILLAASIMAGKSDLAAYKMKNWFNVEPIDDSE